MDRKKFEHVEELFHEARGLAPADRASFLDEGCGGDLELRAEIESLLVHSDRDTAKFDLRREVETGATRISDHGPAAEGPGTKIGVYKILQMIGEGGFGAVYMAEQEEPFRRKVALKIIKLGMDTKQVIARFEAERQALALMDHPNIARVFDAGATGTGRPYFVMELVKGVPIMEYCDRSKLATDERLALFIDVCHAVQHAHHKGIIHRDLKPSNVLVTLHDGRPVPKIIDFGIAKAVSQRLTDKTLFTEFRQLVGTPEYMSPEQAEMSGLDVDTRADIYSLGVLLYELLTGTTPFEPRSLRDAGYGEIQRIIREEEPPKPSTRLETLVAEWSGISESNGSSGDGSSSFSDSAQEIARRRRTDMSALRRTMRGDLDWIVMKAIEKDRTRRYDTANEFAADVRRHLDEQPVLAGPPSVSYKFSKFVGRHRLGVTAGLLIAAALIIGVSLATVGLVQARREASHSREVSEFLQNLTIRMEPGAARAGDASVGEIVERGRALFGDDHAVVGTLLMTRASALNTAGRIDEALLAQREALTHYRTAHPGDHPSVAAALSALGTMLSDRNDYLEAEEVLREALAMKRRLAGEKSRLVADALADLTKLLLTSVGAKRRDEIKELWRETVAVYDEVLGPRHRMTVIQRASLGQWLHANGFPQEARPLLEQSVDEVRRVMGDDNIMLFLVLNALAQHMMLVERDLPAVAELVAEMIRIGDRIWGPMNEAMASIRLELAVIHEGIDDRAEAGRVLSRYVEDRRGSSWSPGLATTMMEQKVVVVLMEWFEENLAVGREYVLLVADDVRQLPGIDTRHLDKVLEHVAEWLSEHDFDADAEPLLVELLALRRAADPIDPDDLAYALIMLGSRKIRLGRPEEAEPLLRECLEIRRSNLAGDHWLVANTRSTLGASLSEQGKFDEAEPLLIEGYEGMQASSETPDVRKDASLERIIGLYEAWDKPDLAAEWRARRSGEA